MVSKMHTVARILAFASLIALAAQGSAQRGGARGGGQARSSSGTHHKGKSTHHASGTQRSGTNRNVSATNANRANSNRVNNGNINTGNVNVNVNGNGHGYGYGYGAHPVARGVVAGATVAAVMGHRYSTLPSGCAVVNQGGMVYHHCGSTWYRNEGNEYLVVSAP